MNDFLRLGRPVALFPVLSCAALAAWSQAPAEDSASGKPTAKVTLPGTVVERNVFVPVDSSGHTGGEYIVVERRVVAKPGAAQEAATEVPTHFILVPQDSDDEETAPGGSSEGDGEVQPR
jgi:hypothetical protein